MAPVVTRKRKPQRKVHAIPCTQQDNIDNLKESVAKIERNVEKIREMVKGNGEKDGIEKNLTQLVDSSMQLHHDFDNFKKEFAVVAGTNKDLEFNHRLNIEMAKYKAEQEEIALKKEADRRAEEAIRTHKGSFSFQKISVLIAAIALVVTATFTILNYIQKNQPQTNQHLSSEQR